LGDPPGVVAGESKGVARGVSQGEAVGEGRAESEAEKEETADRNPDMIEELSLVVVVRCSVKVERTGFLVWSEVDA